MRPVFRYVPSFWRRYWIVGLALVLSGITFAAARSVSGSGWIIAGLQYGPLPPCTRLEAFQGLRVRSYIHQVEASIAQQSVRVRTDGKLELVDTPSGKFWVPAQNTDVLVAILAHQSTGAYAVGHTPIRAGDIVLDGGAHVGVFTRVALAAGAKTVVAIEPAPENLECLRRNLQREIASGRVIVYPKGVWNCETTLPMHLNLNSAGDSFVQDLDPRKGSIDLPLTTIDRLVAELNLPRVDFVKLDIKGAEVQALEGARSTIERFHPRLAVAAEHLPNDNVAIPRVVKKADAYYKVACGGCYLDKNQVRPMVLHFY